MKQLLRLTGFLPLGFALFFAGTTLEIFHDVVYPKYPDMRLMSFGIGLMQFCGFIVTTICALVLFLGIPWRAEKPK